ncbi:MAG: hypothetical protein IJO10_10265 [Clostridia bacterium]|nr:hypothetical protein [Clostridia bacterium]
MEKEKRRNRGGLDNLTDKTGKHLRDTFSKSVSCKAVRVLLRKKAAICEKRENSRDTGVFGDTKHKRSMHEKRKRASKESTKGKK